MKRSNALEHEHCGLATHFDIIPCRPRTPSAEQKEGAMAPLPEAAGYRQKVDHFLTSPVSEVFTLGSVEDEGKRLPSAIRLALSDPMRASDPNLAPHCADAMTRRGNVEVFRHCELAVFEHDRNFIH